MKNKLKLLVASAAIATMVLGCGALAACDNDDNNDTAHEHTYATTWTHDETNHWHAATCEHKTEKSGTAAHNTDGTDGACSVCGYKPQGGGEDEASITLDEDELYLSITNLEAQLTATVVGGGEVEWSSDNEGVVLVGENGAVEALKPGSATITATIKGTEISATCDVAVADAYYIIGGQDAQWNKVGTFGQSNAIYFMPTETEGIYKTASFELNKLGNFQIALVGITADTWWQSAYNGDYIAESDTVLYKNEGGNIAVEKHGMYTVTLDLTGEEAVVTGVCDREIDDGDVVDVYYLIGGMNNWTTADTEEAAGDYAFTNNEDGTYTLVAQLTKGQEFKVVIVGMAYNGALGESALPRTKIGAAGSATASGAYQLEWTSSDNIGVGVSGTYTFTLTPDGAANQKLDYTFEPAEGGDEETELKFVDGGAYLVGENFPNALWNLKTENYIDPENGLTVSFTKSSAFKVIYSKKDSPDWNTIPQYAMAEGKEEGYLNIPGTHDNGSVITAGTYTITIGGTEEVPVFIFTPAADLEPDNTVYYTHYYIKGAKVTNNWGEPTTSEYELAETVKGESGVYTMTIALEANDEFMFWAQQENAETGEKTKSTAMIQYGQLADGVTCVGQSGVNFLSKEAGTYTFTYTASTNKITVEFVAVSTPDTPDAE